MLSGAADIRIGKQHEYRLGPQIRTTRSYELYSGVHLKTKRDVLVKLVLGGSGGKEKQHGDKGGGEGGGGGCKDHNKGGKGERERLVAKGEREIKALKKLKHGPGIPRLLWGGREGPYLVLITELLGANMEEQLKVCDSKFSVKTLLMLAEQLLATIEYVHGRGLLHRRICPDNIALGGAAETSCRIYLTGFEHCKSFLDSQGNHVPYREGRPFVGSSRFASASVQLGREAGRRDDLEAWLHCLLYLYHGELPWQHIRAANRKQKLKRIAAKKRTISVAELVSRSPPEFEQIATYIRSLDFADAPDYALLRGILVDMYARRHFVKDFAFDWTVRGPSSPPSPLLLPSASAAAIVDPSSSTSLPPSLMLLPSHSLSPSPNPSASPHPHPGDNETPAFSSSASALPNLPPAAPPQPLLSASADKRPRTALSRPSTPRSGDPSSSSSRPHSARKSTRDDRSRSRRRPSSRQPSVQLPDSPPSVAAAYSLPPLISQPHPPPPQAHPSHHHHHHHTQHHHHSKSQSQSQSTHHHSHHTHQQPPPPPPPSEFFKSASRPEIHIHTHATPSPVLAESSNQLPKSHSHQSVSPGLRPAPWTRRQLVADSKLVQTPSDMALIESRSLPQIADHQLPADSSELYSSLSLSLPPLSPGPSQVSQPLHSSQPPPLQSPPSSLPSQSSSLSSSNQQQQQLTLMASPTPTSPPSSPPLPPSSPPLLPSFPSLPPLSPHSSFLPSSAAAASSGTAGGTAQPLAIGGGGGGGVGPPASLSSFAFTDLQTAEIMYSQLHSSMVAITQQLLSLQRENALMRRLSDECGAMQKENAQIEQQIDLWREQWRTLCHVAAAIDPAKEMSMIPTTTPTHPTPHTTPVSTPSSNHPSVAAVASAASPPLPVSSAAAAETAADKPKWRYKGISDSILTRVSFFEPASPAASPSPLPS